MLTLDRMLQCKLNLQELATELGVCPFKLYEVIESDGAKNKAVYKRLIKIIEKYEQN